MLSNLFMISQLLVSAVACFYMLRLSRGQKDTASALRKESKETLEKLHAMRRVQLTQPLSEKTRPTSFAEIRGQENGKRALLAALCGENPQHVILYGPPGVGKTAAARAALAEAIRNTRSPFGKDARFIEMDATTLRYDERGIADPLMGSVHDPIYQGAGAYGPGGIPQPKAGAVTKAHGGILFLDEIGELPAFQLNRLLKVLEDRRVFFESAYYNRENREIPRHIHDIFQNGLPADFRLVGATTRSPEELPPALRSRCTEIFFDSLSAPDLLSIADLAARKSGFSAEENAILAVADYAKNGRDAVNIMQTAGSFVQLEGRTSITKADILWVAQAGRYTPCLRSLARGEDRIGRVRGLAVSQAGGAAMDLEVMALYRKGNGSLHITGAAETETISLQGRSLSRRGTAITAVENALACIEAFYPVSMEDYQLHITFPASILADGPSAGLSVAVALFSAIYRLPVPDTVAFTGAVTPMGQVLAVGGIPEKVQAAAEAGIKTVYLPLENTAFLPSASAEIIGVNHICPLLARLFGEKGRASSDSLSFPEMS